ncbi:tmRNA-binding protein [Candidatus Blochmanniella floridana]|uniref:SsrA-binding protein n=1 Tax=Blochmanniella floridana TaxID=203907 RepID=Q7VRQ2_BLOFL|nr:tmRNA-binding protein [Candidatus Blochmannia floridanus]
MNIIQNKRVHHKYFIEKEIETGLVLLGWEVKSIRSRKITIENSYVSLRDQEAYMCNANFQIQTNMNVSTPDPTRMRKLLLKKQELSFLTEIMHKKSYTIIILNLFWKNSWIKANIGIAKGKKKYDKRHIVNTHQWKLEQKHIIKCVNK